MHARIARVSYCLRALIFWQTWFVRPRGGASSVQRRLDAATSGRRVTGRPQRLSTHADCSAPAFRALLAVPSQACLKHVHKQCLPSARRLQPRTTQTQVAELLLGTAPSSAAPQLRGCPAASSYPAFVWLPSGLYAECANRIGARSARLVRLTPACHSSLSYCFALC